MGKKFVDSLDDLAWHDASHSIAPRNDAYTTIDLGSRTPQRPASTSAMKRSTIWLNKAGSSRLSTWPDFGNIARPEAARCFFRNRLGSTQLSSSSPQMINAGVGTFRMASVKV